MPDPRGECSNDTRQAQVVRANHDVALVPREAYQEATTPLAVPSPPFVRYCGWDCDRQADVCTSACATDQANGTNPLLLVCG